MNNTVLWTTTTGVVTIASTIVIHMRLYKNYHYICPKCSTSFKPATFWQSVFSLNLGSKRGVKCPTCNRRVLAKVEKD